MSFLEELAQKGIIKKSQIGDVKNRALVAFGGDIDEALTELLLPQKTIL